MALTVSDPQEIVMDGGMRVKIYRIKHDGSTTSWSIVPGETYKHIIGGPVKCYSVSSGTYTVTFTAAGTSAAYTDVMFIACH